MSEMKVDQQASVAPEVSKQADVTTTNEADVTTTPLEADPVLLAARDTARAALAEITEPESIGVDSGHEVHDTHVVTLYFECLLPGYPGWRWAAALSRIDERAPVNVLEVELLPGEGAVTAPDWVPWSVRLAQYRELQASLAIDEASAAEAAAAELAEEDEVDPEDDLLENDFSDFDDEIDGVDVDSAVVIEVDEDGFSVIDEHDLTDLDEQIEIDLDEEHLDAEEE